MAASPSTANLSPNTPVMDAPLFPVAASTHIYLYESVCVNSSGYLVPASDTAGLSFQGMALQEADNSSGSNGTIQCPVSFPDVRDGFRQYDASGAVQSWVGQLVYFYDDHTAALTGSVSHQILIGMCVQVLSSTAIIVDQNRKVV